MQIFALVSALVTILAGSWIGFRLLALSRRTGHTPERLIGIGMLLFGGVAYPLYLVMVATSGSLSRPVELGVHVAANAAYLGCLVTLCLFTRAVFRPTDVWSGALVAVISLIGITGAGLSLAYTFQHPGVPNIMDPQVRLGGALISTAFGFCFMWTSIEAFAYGSTMKKRLALGLADPIIVNRFSVWTIGTGVACLTDFALVVSNGSGLSPAESPIPALLQSASGLACTITWTLTFAPSELYLNWVRRRAGVAS